MKRTRRSRSCRLLLPLAAAADVMEVKLKLPVKPKLQITGEEKLPLAPFVIASKGEKRSDRAAKVDVQSEFNRYMRKQLAQVDQAPARRRAGRRVCPAPTSSRSKAARDYWKEIGARTGADFIVSGVVDFDINDKSPATSPRSTSRRRTADVYQRQVLVEATGFVFDIDLAVFNADTGEMVLEENFRDFKEFDQRNYDEILGLFENLRALESQLVGIFVAQETSGTRYVFTELVRPVPVQPVSLKEAFLKRVVVLLVLVRSRGRARRTRSVRTRSSTTRSSGASITPRTSTCISTKRSAPSLQRVVDAAESAYLDLSKKFNFQISKKIPLIFYATHSAFEQTNVMLNFIPEGVGAFAEPAQNRMVLPIDMPDDELLELITHELTHIFEYEILFQGKFGKNVTANPPQWLMEGLASFMAQDEDSRDRMVLRDAVVNDRIPRVSLNPQGYFAYRFGHAVFQYMQETVRVGRPARLHLRVPQHPRQQHRPRPQARLQRHARRIRHAASAPGCASSTSRRSSPRASRRSTATSFKINPDDPQQRDLAGAVAVGRSAGRLHDVQGRHRRGRCFNIPERRLLKNLTAGYTSRYEYPIVQSFTTGAGDGPRRGLRAERRSGRALREEGARPQPAAHQSAHRRDRAAPSPWPSSSSSVPTYSPDGKQIAFSGDPGKPVRHLHLRPRERRR